MRTEIPPGTLYMLILKALARLGPMHGYGIALHIQQTTDEVLQVEEGSLYPALQRMLLKGWVVAEWRQSEKRRRARYYTLTPLGREQLVAEVAAFERVVTAIRQVIQPASSRRFFAGSAQTLSHQQRWRCEQKRRDESRRGRHECPRHGASGFRELVAMEGDSK